MNTAITTPSPQKLTDLTYGIGQAINDITGTSATNEFNAEQARIQREWETQMSNTAYQRAVADMEKAGLNPAMIYASGGNEASTPNGANASGRAGGYMDVLGGLGNFINSITNARHVDYMTRQDEMSKNNAQGLYKAALMIAKMIK